jgi:hypothetical protein
MSTLSDRVTTLQNRAGTVLTVFRAGEAYGLEILTVSTAVD